MTKKYKKNQVQVVGHKGVQAAKLMAVAMDLFCERDFASVTIKDIARAAKVNSALIYYYFADKEDLFRVMIEHAILQALDNYARLKARHTDPTDLINDWFDNNVEMSVLMRKLVKIMIDYSHGSLRVASIETLISTLLQGGDKHYFHGGAGRYRARHIQENRPGAYRSFRLGAPRRHHGGVDGAVQLRHPRGDERT